jgi:sugar lactone lactonase YvrE
VGNGLRFDADGFLYVADYTEHNVLKIDPKTRKVTVFAHQPKMHQPNDLAITATGVLYASDPNWKDSTGQLWRIDRDGSTHLLASGMGTANGIEVSPDGRTLYVNESNQKNVWAFRITETGDLADKRLLKKFDDFGFDGMRCDVDGNLYITRHGKGTVAVVSPAGELIREIDVLGSKPSNLCFGGLDGRTVYVTEVDHQRIVEFRVERPGLEWQRWQK